MKIPSGSDIEVRLRDKQTIRGRLRTVETENFTLQTGDEVNVQNQEINFKDVKSIKSHQQKVPKSGSQTASKIGKGILWGLAAAGAVVALAVFHAAGAD